MGGIDKLTIEDMRPVNQLHLKIALKGWDGKMFQEEIYWTINKIPTSRRLGTGTSDKSNTDDNCHKESRKRPDDVR